MLKIHHSSCVKLYPPLRPALSIPSTSPTGTVTRDRPAHAPAFHEDRTPDHSDVQRLLLFLSASVHYQCLQVVNNSVSDPSAGTNPHAVSVLEGEKARLSTDAVGLC
jgi:hypothetical protein